MEEFFPFFLVLFAGVFFSDIFRRLHLPWVVALIVGGIVIGPHVLNVFEANDTIIFLGQIGLVFLMFMAGLETKLATFKESRRSITRLSLINGSFPFLVGLGIGFFFGYGWVASLLLGIIFVSSSIAVVIPSLEASGVLGTRLGKSIVASTIVEDVVSLILLSVLLQSTNPVTSLPLPLFYVLLFTSLFALRWVIPKIEWFFSSSLQGAKDLFQQELRSVFVILMGTVIVFEFLGLHPIIAGFFAGLVLSDSIGSDILKEKLRTISYGIFIPIFFVLIGMQANITIFGQLNGALLFVVIIVLGSIFSKFVSGWIGGRVSGFTSKESLLIGGSTIPQLSTTLAVAFMGAELGFLDKKLVTAMIVLSITTTLVSPILIRLFSKHAHSPSFLRLIKEEEEENIAAS